MKKIALSAALVSLITRLAGAVQLAPRDELLIRHESSEVRHHTSLVAGAAREQVGTQDHDRRGLLWCWQVGG